MFDFLSYPLRKDFKDLVKNFKQCLKVGPKGGDSKNEHSCTAYEAAFFMAESFLSLKRTKKTLATSAAKNLRLSTTCGCTYNLFTSPGTSARSARKPSKVLASSISTLTVLTTGFFWFVKIVERSLVGRQL